MQKIKKLFILFLFLLPLPGNSQGINRDSLKIEIQELRKNNDVMLSKRLTDLSVSFLNVGELDSTEIICEEAIEIAKEQQDQGEKSQLLQLGLSNAFRGLSEVERLRGNIEMSKKYALESIDHAEKLQGEYRNELGISYHLLALFYYDRGGYDSSLYYDSKALEIVQELKDTLSIINYLNSISIYYDLLDQSFVSIQKLEEAKDLVDQFNDVDSKVYINLGLSKKVKDKAKKRELLLENYRLYEQLTDPYLQFNTLNYLGEFYNRQNLTDSALVYFDKAADLSVKNKDFISLAAVKVNQIDLFLKKEEYSKALLLIGEVQEIAVSNQNGNLLRNVYSKYVQYYKQINNWEAAFEWNQKLIHYNDSLQSQKIKQEAFDKEIAYKVNLEKLEFDKKSSILKKEKQIQKVIIFFLVLLSIIILIAIYLLWKRYQMIKNKNVIIKNKNAEIREKTKQTMKVQEENHSLKIQQKQNDLERSIANNKMMIAMKTNIIEKLSTLKSEGNIELKSLIVDLKRQLVIEEKVGLMEANNKEVNTGFYEKLMKLGRLSKTELEVCSYIRLNLSTKEIAQLRASTDASIRVSRSRIREKLGLTIEDNLYEFIKKI